MVAAKAAAAAASLAVAAQQLHKLLPRKQAIWQAPLFCQACAATMVAEAKELPGIAEQQQ